jgi:hypothetical protein
MKQSVINDESLTFTIDATQGVVNICVLIEGVTLRGLGSSVGLFIIDDYRSIDTAFYDKIIRPMFVIRNLATVLRVDRKLSSPKTKE